ncbi:hypothetical protein ACK3TF_001822 [Chlorella vulgaris]
MNAGAGNRGSKAGMRLQWCGFGRCPVISGPVLRAIERGMARQRAKPASSDDLLLEPSLVALRKAMASLELPIQSVSLLAASHCQKPAEQAEDGPTVSLAGAGAPASVGSAGTFCFSKAVTTSMPFGVPPASVSVEFGHRCVALLVDALRCGSVELGPASVAELLQAGVYFQVAYVLDAASQYLREQLLDSHPCVVLRFALDLQLAGLQDAIESTFLQNFFKLCGQDAAALLKEWGPDKRRELLQSPLLCSPTECCVVETLCRLAKLTSSADAVSLLSCVRFAEMRAQEVAAASLYFQHNAKWVDKRLSTAMAWRLLNARVAADLAQRTQHTSQQPGTSCNGPAVQPAPASLLQTHQARQGLQGGARAAAARTLLWALQTSALQEFSGTSMYCTSRHISCSWASPGPSRPLVLQLERGDLPLTAAAQHAGAAGEAASCGGSDWDLQLRLDATGPALTPFPAGFKATCFAFGTEGLFFCPLGPLAAPGPTWWKVGFLSSQLPRALPLALLGGDTYQGGMLLFHLNRAGVWGIVLLRVLIAREWGAAAWVAVVLLSPWLAQWLPIAVYLRWRVAIKMMDNLLQMVMGCYTHHHIYPSPEAGMPSAFQMAAVLLTGNGVMWQLFNSVWGSLPFRFALPQQAGLTILLLLYNRTLCSRNVALRHAYLALRHRVLGSAHWLLAPLAALQQGGWALPSQHPSRDCAATVLAAPAAAREAVRSACMAAMAAQQSDRVPVAPSVADGVELCVRWQPLSQLTLGFLLPTFYIWCCELRERRAVLAARRVASEAERGGGQLPPAAARELLPTMVEYLMLTIPGALCMWSFVALHA